MKRIIALIVVGLMFGVGGKAQITYHKYLDSSCEWRRFMFGGDIGLYIGYKTTYFDGDTIINGKYYYRKIDLIRDYQDSTIKVGTGYFVREDSSKKIWQYESHSNTERLIMDYDSVSKFKVGDSFANFYYPNPNFNTCTVDHKDTFYFNNTPYNFFGALSYINQSRYDCGVIEGIGQTMYFFCGQNLGCYCDEFLYYYDRYNKSVPVMKFPSLMSPPAPPSITYDSFPHPKRIHQYTALPVVIKYFSIIKKENDVMLNWQTANEINVHHYEIQQSTDGTAFTTIGKVNAKNKASNEYSLTTNYPLLSTNYYRVVAVDNDGKKTYSEVKSLVFSSKSLVGFYPNPCKDILNVVGEGIEQVTIADNTGRTVKHVNNLATKQLNLSQLNKGIYFITIQTKTSTSTQKLFKY